MTGPWAKTPATTRRGNTAASEIRRITFAMLAQGTFRGIGSMMVEAAGDGRRLTLASGVGYIPPGTG